MSIIGDISLYFHIPFCRKQCPYCNFYTTTIKNEEIYLNALLLEIIKYKNILTTNNIISIYFGGGSPWLFGEKKLSIILETLKKNFKISSNCEITIELNPEDIKSPSDALSLKNINVNRVSIGVQAFNDFILKKLERNHNFSHSINSISFISKYIKNISIDLMYDIPYQTLAIWEENFNIIESNNLPIQHISIYNLTIEKNKSF